MEWEKLNLSLLGKIAFIKMIVLPKVFFFLQTIPVVKGEKQFDEWQKRISKFLWSGKRARIKMKHLMDDKNRGGLQLPNFKLYQDAVCLTWIRDWVNLSNQKLLNLEGFNRRFGWHSYLFYEKLKVDNTFAHHYIRNNLLNTWLKYIQRIDLKRPLWMSPFDVIEMGIMGREYRNFTYQDFIQIINSKFELKKSKTCQ